MPDYKTESEQEKHEEGQKPRIAKALDISLETFNQHLDKLDLENGQIQWSSAGAPDGVKALGRISEIPS